MKLDQFWNTVPNPVRMASIVIISISALVGLAMGFSEGLTDGRLSNQSAPFHVGTSAFGVGAGLLVGCFVAIWILCLGYVYADARRRAMPPVLWTLIAALIPNLLGFLLYFALRRPLVSLCVQCRHPGDVGRFCSSCGVDKYASPTGSVGSAGLGSSPV